MRLFLELLLLAGLIAFATVYAPILWRRARARRAVEVIPAAAPSAVRLADRDERLREAVDLRDKIAELARRPEVGLGSSVVHEVDALVQAMVGLHEMKTQLGMHLSTISEERIARDAQLLDGESAATQRRQLDAMRERERSLETELARAVAGLRETWLGLLDAIARPGSGDVASDRIRAQIETLRIHIQAEREARSEVGEP